MPYFENKPNLSNVRYSNQEQEVKYNLKLTKYVFKSEIMTRQKIVSSVNKY